MSIDSNKQIRVGFYMDGVKRDMQLNSFAHKCKVPFHQVLECYEHGFHGQALCDMFYSPDTTKIDLINNYLLKTPPPFIEVFD